MKQLLDEHGERVGAYRVFSQGDDVLPVRRPGFSLPLCGSCSAPLACVALRRHTPPPRAACLPPARCLTLPWPSPPRPALRCAAPQGLAMSRSLGDLYAHEVGVSPEPVLNTYTLGERDLFLVRAACLFCLVVSWFV